MPNTPTRSTLTMAYAIVRLIRRSISNNRYRSTATAIAMGTIV